MILLSDPQVQQMPVLDYAEPLAEVKSVPALVHTGSSAPMPVGSGRSAPE
ncbi:MAG: hypothetical protein ACR2JX_10650 [Mycobacteriales bacterium]